jgi:hypothetical protein
VDGVKYQSKWNYRIDFVLTPFEACEAREAEAKALRAVASPDPITWDSMCAANELYRRSAALPTTPASPPALIWNRRCTAVQYVRPDGTKITRHLTYLLNEATPLRNGERRMNTITVTRGDIQNALRRLIIRHGTSWSGQDNLWRMCHELCETEEHSRTSDWMDAARVVLDRLEVLAVRYKDLGELFPYYF